MSVGAGTGVLVGIGVLVARLRLWLRGVLVGFGDAVCVADALGFAPPPKSAHPASSDTTAAAATSAAAPLRARAD
ncbi:hypothetical protein [Leifsonia sp. Leaf336]|uniref:hypothetical protein n=1 Tax=Leifsonia sp. Leaf336 TaxID=1736341 RepID=UPI0012FB158D|nr:hypothetical protein [Leifsonia sp. Leaf336]